MLYFIHVPGCASEYIYHIDLNINDSACKTAPFTVVKKTFANNMYHCAEL